MNENKLIEKQREIKQVEALLAKLESDDFDDTVEHRKEVKEAKTKLRELREKAFSKLNPWDRVQICRHKDRPHSSDVIENISDSFMELHGDRLFADDEAIIGGLAYIGGKRFMVIAQEKGRDTESRLKHNFGMPHPEGYRKALRLMEMAEKFDVPILSLIDTPGAYPGLAAEERGQGWAIAKNLWKMAQIKTPMICIIIGEGCSGGALGIGMGDSIGMLENAYYSVISPEGCASILFKDASKKTHTAEILKMLAEDLIESKVIDEIIKEPLGGAHNDPKLTYSRIKQFILEKREALSKLDVETLIERRYHKFRELGEVGSN